MKQTTKDWFIAAEDDLLAAIKLRESERLTNLVAFHCQQCIEKCFKAIIEELEKPALKSHNLIRLQAQSNVVLDDDEIFLLSLINEVYIDSRYPGDIGLMPHGRPTLAEANRLIQFSERLYYRLIREYSTNEDQMID